MKNQIKAIILRRLLKVFILRSAHPKTNSMKYTIPAGTEANKPKTATKPTAQMLSFLHTWLPKA